MARPGPTGLLGATGRRTRNPARSPRLATAARRRSDPLRVLRAGDALGGTEAHHADDRTGATDQRHSSPPVTRGEETRGPRADRALPLPGGRPRHQRAADPGRLEEGA